MEHMGCSFLLWILFEFAIFGRLIRLNLIVGTFRNIHHPKLEICGWSVPQKPPQMIRLRVMMRSLSTMEISQNFKHFRHISQVVVHWIRNNQRHFQLLNGLWVIVLNYRFRWSDDLSFEDSPGLNISQNQWLWVLGSSHSANGSFSYLEPSYTYYPPEN